MSKLDFAGATVLILHKQLCSHACIFVDVVPVACAARPALGGRLPGPSLAASFPPALLESALAVWRASVRQTGRMSKLHEQVSQALWAMSMPHTNEHLTLDGLFCVDIALEGSKVTGPSLSDFAVS